MEIRINAVGLQCPKPVIETKKALSSIKEGNIITIVDNEIARENISKLAKSLKLDYCIQENNGTYEISIFKGSYADSPESLPEKTPDHFNTVILFTRDVMGQGSDELGTALMKSYIYALSESEPYPKTLLFLNGGVKLTTGDAAIVKHLQKLEASGTEIISCGACLEYYGLVGSLKVGEVGNMYTIVEKTNEAGNTITI